MPAIESLPSSTRIAIALLDVLARSGDVEGHARVLRELGGDEAALRAARAGVPRAKLDGALHALKPERRLLRRVGRELVSPESLGASLYYGGLATVEKAYRRVDQLLAREDEAGRYEPTAIANGSACVHFHSSANRDSDDSSGLDGEGEGEAEGDGDGRGQGEAPAAPVYCGIREGMLEAIPLCFGLLPARVKETECVESGASRCSFEVEWTATSRRGLLLGMLAGSLVGAAVAFAMASGMAPVFAGLIAAACGIAGGAAGRSLDLARQLEAVAGARRGHLALLDQADQSIAEKMDELAKVEASLDSSRGQRPAGGGALTERASSDEEARAERLLAVRASEEIYGALGPLQRGLGDIHEELVESKAREKSEPIFDRELVVDSLQRCVEEARHIQAVGAELAGMGTDVGRFGRAVSLADVVSRAADVLRAELPPELSVDLEIAEALPLVRCEPFQMEQVVYQLLRNAVDATGAEGTIWVTLAAHAGGLELVVSDKGEGFSEESIDEVFDPFAADAPAGEQGGLGLAICYRVIEEHSGELSISAGEQGGTRVSVVMPPDLAGEGASGADRP